VAAGVDIFCYPENHLTRRANQGHIYIIPAICTSPKALRSSGHSARSADARKCWLHFQSGSQDDGVSKRYDAYF
jgi:hypothetical protein